MTICIKNVRILADEADGYSTKSADVYLDKDRISKIDYDMNSDQKADYVIDGTGRLMMPGLVNSHTHAYMSLLRNCADDVSFDKWLFETVEPMENRLLQEDGYWGTLLAHIEMIKSGTTSYVDMHMFPNQTARAVAESGMRAVLTRGLVGDTAESEGGRRRLREAKEEMEEWSENDRLSFMLAPHAPYSCGRDFLRLVADEAERLGLGINIHLAESEGEIKGIRDKTGLTPIEYAASAGVFKNRCLAAHCVYLTGNDVRLLKDNKVSVVTNPASNMKLANGFAPLPSLLDKGINCCLGTDGAASNNSLNMFREMAMAALIHKGTTKNPKAVSAVEVLRMATVNGARAIGKEAEIGRIEEGMKADLILINLHSASLIPYNNIVSSLVYSATGAEVETVIIDGRIILEKNELKTIDEERVFFEAERIAGRTRNGAEYEK